MVDEVVHEFFGGDVEDVETVVFIQGEMTDGVHEVGFAQAGAAVDIKGIVGLGRVLGHGQRGRVGELIAGADDVIFKSVIGIEVGVKKRAVLGPAFLGRSPHEVGRGFFKDVFDIAALAEKLLREVVDQGRIMKREPVSEIGIGDFDVEAVLFPADVGGRLEPCFVAVVVDPFLDFVKNPVPMIKFFFALHDDALDFHSFFHRCGKTLPLLHLFPGESLPIIAPLKPDFKGDFLDVSNC